MTTTVFGLAAATAATSSSWSPGRASDVRSSPSVSQSSSVPTMTIASSAAAATAAARATWSLSGTRRAPTTSPRTSSDGWLG